MYWLRMLNLTRSPPRVLDTLKKNHCEYPFVLMSFCKRRLYSHSVTFETKERLPHSKRDSNTRVRSYDVEGV